LWLGQVCATILGLLSGMWGEGGLMRLVVYEPLAFWTSIIMLSYVKLMVWFYATLVNEYFLYIQTFKWENIDWHIQSILINKIRNSVRVLKYTTSQVLPSSRKHELILHDRKLLTKLFEVWKYLEAKLNLKLRLNESTAFCWIFAPNSMASQGLPR